MSKDYPEYDKNTGLWFRRPTPNSIEYQPQFNFCGKSTERTVQPTQEEQRGFCPFRNHHIRCSQRCVMYDGKGCKIAATPAKTDTKGKACMFSSFICAGNCAVYNHGCTWIENFGRRIEE